MLGSSLLLSTEAMIAKTDAVLCGATTLALAALGRIYAAARDGPPAPRSAVWLFWAAIGVAALVKGPVGPLVAALAIIVLAVLDRRPGWLVHMRWWWGLVVVALIVGPWAGAVTVATDGGFWSQAVGGDLAPKLAGGQESHGAPPGFHTLLAPILSFPITLLLPAAAVTAWRRRREPGVRFALAWLIPTWVMFEAMPTKLVHYPMPTYGALAWLAAAALVEPIGAGARWTGAILGALVGVALAAGSGYLVSLYGDPSDLPAAIAAGVLLAGAGLAGAFLVARDNAGKGVAVAGVLTVLGHGALLAGLAPRLEPLWLSARTEAALEKAQLLPRQGIADAPVAVTGYAEPSLVFALGTGTELGSPVVAARAIAENRPAVVEGRKEPDFRKALEAVGAQARQVGEVRGLDYSNGDRMTLRVYEARGAAAQEVPR
jgi:4-amino-4-deoxy-L-arabinose transferase-like glycosyltransferase